MIIDSDLEKEIMDKAYALHMTKQAEFISSFKKRHESSGADSIIDRANLQLAFAALKELRIYKAIYNRCQIWHTLMC